jgi:hypothetical protein
MRIPLENWNRFTNLFNFFEQNANFEHDQDVYAKRIEDDIREMRSATKRIKMDGAEGYRGGRRGKEKRYPEWRGSDVDLRSIHYSSSLSVSSPS